MAPRFVVFLTINFRRESRPSAKQKRYEKHSIQCLQYFILISLSMYCNTCSTCIVQLTCKECAFSLCKSCLINTYIVRNYPPIFIHHKCLVCHKRFPLQIKQHLFLLTLNYHSSELPSTFYGQKCPYI